MLAVKTYSKSIVRTLSVWLILFSLLPCATREFLADMLDISHQRPLNQIKTTNVSSGCYFASEVNAKKTATEKEDERKHDNHFPYRKQQRIVARALHTPKAFAFVYAGNSPPKYILYKRLKIATV